ncbi:hypothetical protein CsSME_00025470 [Camellia sinensis var. sinensis]
MRICCAWLEMIKLQGMMKMILCPWVLLHCCQIEVSL